MRSKREFGLPPDSKKRQRLVSWLRTELPRQFLGRLLAVDDRVALAWGRLAAKARRANPELPVIDGLLRDTAAAHDLTFVTRSPRYCSDRGVPLLNPWEEA